MNKNVYELEFKPINKKELANFIGVSEKTLNIWIRKKIRQFGKYAGKCFTPTQIELIDKNITNGKLKEYIKNWMENKKAFK